MVGTIYLGGGGGAAEEELLWRAMLRDKHRVVYWPFALPPDMVSGAVQWLTSSLRHLQMDVEVETWVDPGRHSFGEFSRADLIFVGGGNTFQLLAQVRRHGYEQAVRDFVAAGGDFYGGSAGAILACSDIGIAEEYDANDVGLTDLTGLDLVPDLVVLPHFDRGQQETAQRWSRKHGCAVLGIPERSGVVARGDRLQALGFAEVLEVDGSMVTTHQPGDQWKFTPRSSPAR